MTPLHLNFIQEGSLELSKYSYKADLFKPKRKNYRKFNQIVYCLKLNDIYTEKSK